MLPLLRHVDTAQGRIAFREAGRGTPLVLLHGIGAGAASWGGQFDAFAAHHRVIAWDAPGYGSSAPLTVREPLAVDYARALDALLDAIDVGAATVVGHSLGALKAAHWAATTRRPVSGLVLASPARGYASAAPDVREGKFRERVELVERLGVEGLAAQRSAGLCAPHASAEAVAIVRENMARITPGGYAQAAWMLAHDDLMPALRRGPKPLAVLCGEFDRTTPPEACEKVAQASGAPFVLMKGVAHACYVEDPAQFNAALEHVLAEAVHG